MAVLDAKLFLLLDQQLQDLEIGDLRAQLPLHQRLADIDPLLDHRNHRLELVNGGPGRGLFGFLLRLLTRERGDLGAMLGDLVEQQLTLGADQDRVRTGRRREVGRMIIAGRQRRARSRATLSCSASRSLLEVVAFGGIHGRIELDQHVAGFNRLPVLHPDGANHPGLERLDDLGAPARHDLPGRRSHDVDRAPPRPDQRRAEQHDDRRYDRPPDRRWRCLHDLERGRQKGELFAPVTDAPERDDDFSPLDGKRAASRLHRFLPATGATPRNARRS